MRATARNHCILCEVNRNCSCLHWRHLFVAHLFIYFAFHLQKNAWTNVVFWTWTILHSFISNSINATCVELQTQTNKRLLRILTFYWRRPFPLLVVGSVHLFCLFVRSFDRIYRIISPHSLFYIFTSTTFQYYFALYLLHFWWFIKNSSNKKNLNRWFTMRGI